MLMIGEGDRNSRHSHFILGRVLERVHKGRGSDCTADYSKVVASEDQRSVFDFLFT